ncbi:MAG: response regulator transcription factor [Desulfatibacillaceae bacterium]
MRENNTFLVVDDNPLFREVFVDLLKMHFPEKTILEARDGEEACDVAAARHPCLVFMDYRMPGIDGFKATTAIKEENRNTRVMMLTNHNGLEYRAASERAGADCYMNKDVAPGELVRAAKNLIGRTGC